jgi:hypothetical protein
MHYGWRRKSDCRIYRNLESNSINQTLPVGRNPVGLALGIVEPWGGMPAPPGGGTSSTATASGGGGGSGPAGTHSAGADTSTNNGTGPGTVATDGTGAGLGATNAQAQVLQQPAARAPALRRVTAEPQVAHQPRALVLRGPGGPAGTAHLVAPAPCSRTRTVS